MIRGRNGYIAISYIEPKVENNIKVCLNCGNPLPKGRRKYCCDECSYEFFVKHNFTLLKFKIFDRDDYTCQDCGYKWEINKDEKEQFDRYRKEHSSWLYRITWLTLTDCLQCDHIVPICLGGAEFDEDNLQTLCIECHKKKTAEDMKVLAEKNRKEKEEGEKRKFEEKRARYSEYWEKMDFSTHRVPPASQSL